jgi:hypothetical protein
MLLSVANVSDGRSVSFFRVNYLSAVMVQLSITLVKVSMITMTVYNYTLLWEAASCTLVDIKNVPVPVSSPAKEER